MSVKDLFKPQPNISFDQNQINKDLENEDLSFALIKNKNKFIPSVDYTSPKNFAKFGSAERYYLDSIKEIYATYPYDGSLFEKTSWAFSASDLTNYIFDNLYPRTNGYINFGRNYGSSLSTVNGYDQPDTTEYIFFKGGPNTYLSSSSTKELFDKANKYHTASMRSTNLALDGASGSTVEFWMKKGDLNGSAKQVIFDLWNSSSTANTDYGRFRIEIRPGTALNDRFYIEIRSGSAGVNEAQIGANLNFTSSWNHYAIGFQNTGNSLNIELYCSGTLLYQITTGSSIGAVTGAMVGQIGSLMTNTPGDANDRSWGKLSASLDEFRYWKIKRTDKQISRNWFTQVYGGANKIDSNTSLGLYYKFNEGIYDINNINRFDSTVLDYSGRISNGTWVGAQVGSRHTGSAILLSSASLNEFQDPIIYSSHQYIQDLINRLQNSGSEYDKTNNAAMLNMFPEWIIDEEKTIGEGTLENIVQVMAGFFDDLFLKIQALPSIKNIEYNDTKPLPFAKSLLENYGFQVSDLFTDATILENFLSRDENINFQEDLDQIRNSIYQNIYNNLLYLYRSKGTLKSLRNFLRCFGVDEKILKINTYADNVEFTFDDRFSLTTEKKNFINFNNTDRFIGTVYQHSGTTNNPDMSSFISGNTDFKYLGNTIEAQIIFPKKFDVGHPLYFSTPFVSSSLFGHHTAKENYFDIGWATQDSGSLQVFALRPSLESKDIRFLLTSSYLGIKLTSSLFYDVYNDQKWNLAVRIKHQNYPYTEFTTINADTTGSYIVELYGVNAIQDIVNQTFILTASITSTLGENYFAANKRLYIGSHYTDFTGSIVLGDGQNFNNHYCDVKIGSLRYWHNYLPNEIIDLHAKDVLNYGPEGAYQNVKPFYISPLKTGKYIPQIETLALHWDFELVSGSDNGDGSAPTTKNDAGFFVEDVSSGTLDAVSNNGFLERSTKYRYVGRGNFFPRLTQKVVSREYLYSGKRSLPETINSDDLTKILSFDEEQLSGRDTLPVNHYFSIEKNPYQNISEEMLKWFGTIKDFNNLIGKPKYKYEASYKEIDTLRRMFFRKVDNTVDFEKFVDFYKWIDDGVSQMLSQLLPASTNINSNFSTVIESHILERNKIQHKIPILFQPKKFPEFKIKTIGEIKYDWQNGSRPISGLQSDHCFYWKYRAERSGTLNSADRVGISQVVRSGYERSLNEIASFEFKPIEVLPGRRQNDIMMVLGSASIGWNNTQFISITASALLPQNINCSDDEILLWKRNK